MPRPTSLVLLGAAALLAAAAPAGAQMRTMNTSCRQQLAAARQLNNDKQYDSALVVIAANEPRCKTSDAREAYGSTKARSLNGLERHEEAITAAEGALAASKQQSLYGLFERGIARDALGQKDAAAQDFNQIVALTEKNRNVKERATIYAKIADLDYQAGRTADGDAHMAKAMELDPGNATFLLLKGDNEARNGNYDAAFASYDQAVAKGQNGLDVYQTRTNARIKQMQQKYETTNTQTLRSKMTGAEKAQVCVELTKAQSLGLRDMRLDMFGALVCK